MCPGLPRGCRQAGRVSEPDMISEARQGRKDSGASSAAPPAPHLLRKSGDRLIFAVQSGAGRGSQPSVGTRS